MNEITSNSITLKECSANEANIPNLSLNGNVDQKAVDIEIYKVVNTESNDESTNIGLPIMSVSSSMQDRRLTVIRSNKSLNSISTEYTGNTGLSNAITSLSAESASFALLSRRESSLENLAEDESGLHNSCISTFGDASTPILVDKSGVAADNTTNSPKKIESSRLRRTLTSLLSCCTQKSRRSQFSYRGDLITSSTEESAPVSTIEKCPNVTAHKSAASQPEGDHISFSCIKLKKFLDIFDEPDSPGKRMTQLPRLDTKGQTPTAFITRDGEKSDSSGKNLKIADTFQSENGGANLTRPVLLGAIKPADNDKKCFIIDLDETLVHSSFKMVEKADFKVGVDIEGTVHTVYVLKRPYVDVFLQKMGRIFECVLFTASLAKYADPVTDFLDKWRVFRWRLFRESCVFHRGNYVKDLSMLGRHIDQVAILDNSPASYMFHPDNAVQVTSWFDDPRDTALLDLIPYFEQLAAAPSVPPFLATVKPPQRATVPVSVMFTSPASISLQPLSQLHQHQQHQPSSPITSIGSSTNTNSADLNSSNPATTVSQPLLPLTTVYVGDINLQRPFSRSLKSLSNITSKSMPSLFASCTIPTPRSCRSENDLHTVLSCVYIDQQSIGLHTEISRRRISRSTSDLSNYTIDKSPFNHTLSRSFPALVFKRDQANRVNIIPETSSVQPIIMTNSPMLRRSASFSFQRLSSDKSLRSWGSCFNTKSTGLRYSLIGD